METISISSILLLISGILILVNYFKPSLDKIQNGDILLWYNFKNKRNFINLSNMFKK